jgi:hypothetical protein
MDQSILQSSKAKAPEVSTRGSREEDKGKNFEVTS